MGASAAAGHVVGCWLLHPMPSGRGGPFHSAAVGWEAVRGTAPVASTSGQDRAVRGERGREKRPVLWPTEMRGSFKYVQTDPPCHPSCCAREISLRYKDTLKSWARSLKGSQRTLKCVSPRGKSSPTSRYLVLKLSSWLQVLHGQQVVHEVHVSGHLQEWGLRVDSRKTRQELL